MFFKIIYVIKDTRKLGNWTLFKTLAHVRTWHKTGVTLKLSKNQTLTKHDKGLN